MSDRLLRIALFHNLPSGGAKRAVYELAKGLTSRGHELHEFRLSSADNTYLPLAGVTASETVVPFPRWTWNSVPIPGLSPHVNAIRHIAALERLRRVSRQLASIIDRQGYDVVWVNDCMIVLKPFLGCYLKTPCVLFTHHGAYGGRYVTEEQRQEARARTLPEALKSAFYGPSVALAEAHTRRVESENARSYDRVLTNSCFAAESYYQHFGIPAWPVRLGVSDTFHPAERERAAYVLSVGSVTYCKGYRFLVTALSKIERALRPPLLIVANAIEPREHQVLQHMAAELDVHLAVQQVWDDEVLADIYRRARLFAYSPILEPLGLAALEAMACGTPVVAVKEGGPRESVCDGQTGYLVPREAELFAESVSRLLANPHLTERMGKAASSYVASEWTWPAATHALEQRLFWIAGHVPRNRREAALQRAASAEYRRWS